MAEPHMVHNEWSTFQPKVAPYDRILTCEECGDQIFPREAYIEGTWSTTDHTAQRYADVACDLCYQCYLNITEDSSSEHGNCIENGCSIM